MAAGGAGGSSAGRRRAPGGGRLAALAVSAHWVGRGRWLLGAAADATEDPAADPGPGPACNGRFWTKVRRGGGTTTGVADEALDGRHGGDARAVARDDGARHVQHPPGRPREVGLEALHPPEVLATGVAEIFFFREAVLFERGFS